MKVVSCMLALLTCGVLSTVAAAGDGADAPIDTSITVHQGHDTNKSTKGQPLKNAKASVAVGTSPKQDQIAGRQPAPVLQRNAIGAKVDSGKTADSGAATARTPVASSTATPAAQPATSSTPQGAGAPVSDPSTKAANGPAPTNSATPATTPTDKRTIGNAALVVVTKNAPSINGTGMMRPGAGTGVVGGPAKITAGVVSGNSIHLKHP